MQQCYLAEKIECIPVWSERVTIHNTKNEIDIEEGDIVKIEGNER